jgi:DNA-binding beta-propeller fold protein YncE
MTTRTMLLILVLVSVVLPAGAHDKDDKNDKYEVWAIDQSNPPGLSYGGTLYIYDGKSLERGHRPQVTRIDLAGQASALCFQRTGANPVRPHMVAFNASQTHAILSFVASGHVLFINAATRRPVECVRSSIGAGGARQAHMAMPSPDETYVTVANQNGKLLERIDTNYVTESFLLNSGAMLNLATCTTANGNACEQAGIRDDNAPICPVIESTSRYNFVTLRGGGLFVVDAKATPMRIVAEYDKATVHPNGCGGAETRGKMYITSGGGTAANLYEADLYAFPVRGFSTSNPPNVPERKVVFSEDVDHADGHGVTLTKHGRYLWVADRGRNLLFVVNTRSDKLISRIHLGGDDPTPDLMVTSPNGSHVFVSLRGPNPLSGDPHVSTGATPGVGVLKVQSGGRSATFETIFTVTNKDATGVERADVHGIALRRF